MIATETQRDLIARLRETGHGPGLIAGTMGVQWQTAVRMWDGKVAISPPMEDWLTRYAAWVSRNPPPPRPGHMEEGGQAMEWLIFLLAANAVLLLANAVFCLACRRMFRRLIVLDRLLTEIVTDAFCRAHQPVFQAWSRTMGEFQVIVQSGRRAWDDETGGE